MRNRRWPLTPVAAALWLGLYVALTTSAAARKSQTFDEVAHVTAGYAYWTLNDYRLHPENGNWPQRLGTLPALLDRIRFPSLEDSAWRRSDAYAVGETFFFQSGNDVDRLLWQGRASIALLGAGLGAIVFAWSRRLHSPAGGWVSLAMFTLCPTMLAHGGLVTSDMAAALAFTASTGALWLLLHRITPLTLAASTAAMTLLFLSKFSAPIILPIAAGLVAIRLSTRQPLPLSALRWTAEIAGRWRQLAVFAVLAVVHAAVVVALIWASFGFRYSAFNPAHGDAAGLLVEWPLVLSGPDGTTPSRAGRVIDWGRGYRLLPEAYLYGMAHTIKFSQSRRAFMNGEYSIRGWRTFFPYAFAIKTTPPLMAMLVLAAGAVAWRWRREGGDASGWRRIAAGAYRASPLWLLLIVYWVFAIWTNLNIGHRHLLPTYPALLILAGGAAGWLLPLRPTDPAPGPRTRREPRREISATETRRQRRSRVRVGAAAVLGVAAWQAFESFSIRPHYLAYFNVFAGGPANGYRRLVDSSLDWGQDLPALKDWLSQNGRGLPAYLSYFGTSSPAHYGIDAVVLPGYLDRREARMPVALTAGWYCVSATMLQGVYLRARGPWTPEYEEAYQAVRGPALALLSAVDSGDQQRVDELFAHGGEQFWWHALETFDHLRTARLMAYLRRREPAANAGYSILIYHLSQADIAEVQDGPPPFPDR